MAKSRVYSSLAGQPNIVTYKQSVTIMRNALRAAEKKVKRETVKALRKYPRKRKKSQYPNWTTERQKRAYFASNGFNAGIPYRRTNGLRRGWNWKRSNNDSGASITVWNEQSYAKYVIGTLDVSSADYLKHKQRFHTDIGWQNASPIVQRAFDALEQEMPDAIREALAEFLRKKEARKKKKPQS